jgi:hypothetical protein
MIIIVIAFTWNVFISLLEWGGPSRPSGTSVNACSTWVNQSRITLQWWLRHILYDASGTLSLHFSFSYGRPSTDVSVQPLPPLVTTLYILPSHIKEHTYCSGESLGMRENNCVQIFCTHTPLDVDCTKCVCVWYESVIACIEPIWVHSM